MTETTSIERGFADVHGARLYYEAAGAGHPLVMLHGHLIDSGQWDDQFELFGRDYRVVRYDARGFGQSTNPPGPFAHYEDLHGLLAFLGIERAYLMGCSGGGAATIDFALAYPQMAGALILVGAGLSGYQFGEPPPLALEMRAAMERGDLERTVELSLQLWTDGENRRPDQVNPAARERIRAMSTRLFAREDVDASPTMLEPPAAGRLAEIAAPTLAIVGDKDVSRIREIADLVAAQVPRARKVVIPDAGHHPNMEHPTLFNRVVLDFMAALPD
jgi:pimeloyl-ACP methyl ester carboxylesterase